MLAQGIDGLMAAATILAFERTVNGLGRCQLFLRMLASPMISEIVRFPEAFTAGVTLVGAGLLMLRQSLLLLFPSFRLLLSHVPVQSILMLVRTAALSAAV